MLGFLGGLTGGALNVGGGALEGLSAAFGALRAAFQFVFSQLMGFGSIVMRAGALLTGTLIGGLLAFGTAIATFTKNASDRARELIDLRNLTGLSTQGARGMAARFGAFGIGPDAVGEMFGGLHASQLSMRARMFGIRDVSNPLEIAQRSQSFGGGFMGFSMRQALLKSLGLDNAQGRFLVNLPQDRIREQLGFQSRMSAQMGVSPQVIEQLGQDLPLLMNRFEIFRNLLVTKLASVALPFVMRGFERLSDFLSARGGQIGELLGRAVEFLMVSVERLINFLLDRGPMIADAIQSVVSWLYADAPVLLMQGLQSLIRAGMGFTAFFSNLGHTFAANLRLMEQGQGGLFDAAMGIASSLDLIINGFTHLRAALAVTQALIQDIVRASFDIMPGGRLAARALGITVPDYVNPIQAAADVYNASRPSNIAGSLNAFLRNGGMTGTANLIDNSATTLGNYGQQYGQSAIDYTNGILQRLGTPEERREEFRKALDVQVKVLANIERNTKATADNTGDTNRAIGGFAANTVNRALAYIAEDAYLGLAGS